MAKRWYRYVGASVDPVDGWWKYTLRRDDGRVVKVGKSRMRVLRREGRLCDCENPEPESGPALVSNECPVHNINPRPSEPADEDAETDAYAMMMGPDAY